MPAATPTVLTHLLRGPRKAETVRRLRALAAVVGEATSLEWIITGIEADHAGNPADWRAEVLAAVRAVLGEDTCPGRMELVTLTTRRQATQPAVIDPNVTADTEGDARFLSDVLHLAQHTLTYAEPGLERAVARRVISEAVGRGGRSLPRPDTSEDR